MKTEPSRSELAVELEDLRARLAEAEEVLRAIRDGEVDAVVVAGERGEQVYTLSGADRAYRQLIETMSEGAATLSADGLVLYGNGRLAEMLGQPLDQVMGSALRDHLPPADQQELDTILARALTAPSHGEINLKTSAGRLVPVYLSADRLPSEEAGMTFCLVLTDLTEQRVQTELRESEEKYRGLFESSRDAIMTLEPPAWRFTSGNPATLKMFGAMNEEEFTARGPWDLSPERQPDGRASAEKAKEMIETAMREGSHFFEWTPRRIGGEEFSADVLLTRMEQGGLQATFRDITARKQAEEELREQETHLEAILEATADGILAVDTKGKVIRASRRFSEIWQIPEPLMESGDDKALLDFVLTQLSDPDGFLKKVQSLNDTDAESFDTLTFKDGRFIERYSFAMIMGGTRIGRVWSFRDVTVRKALEASLAEAVLQANAANNAKSEFLGIMTHELRNPLNGVLGFAELLSDTPLDDEQKGYVRTISCSGEHLLAVVNDTLDFSSIEAGTLAIHAAPFDIANLVKSSSDVVRKSAADKGVAFHCELAAGVPPQITGDERRIHQILINLLANAVKFTSDGSVSLRVTGSGEFVDFTVEDTGLGISPEALDRLFQLFTQADSTIHQKYGGTGLGLAVSQRLAEAMGGAISVVSVPGKGSTFTFRLPLEASGPPSSDPAASVPIEPEPVAHQGNPVLVVDDDMNSRMLAGKMLQSLGYRAEFATDGEGVLQAFATGKYFAILMDVAMPLMDGLEATQKIRELEAAAGCHVPIIAFTANVMPGEREQCLAAGMDGFLSKPFKKEELAAKLACWHSQSHALTHDEK